MKMIIAYIRTEPPPTSCAICTAPASGELPVIRCMEDAVNDRRFFIRPSIRNSSFAGGTDARSSLPEGAL